MLAVFSTPRRRRIWITSLFVAAILGSLTFVYHDRFVASIGAVHETIRLQKGTSEFLSLIRDAETGQRGYLITGDEAFLTPYAAAARNLPATAARLESLAGADPVLGASAGRLKELSQLKMAELAETIALRRAGRTEEALAKVREGSGRRWMVEMRSVVAAMLAREDRRFAAREEAAKARQRELAFILAGVWGLLLSLVSAGLWFATRGVEEAKRANEDLARSERALRTVADNATDLVRVVDDRGTLVYVSPSCETLLGYSSGEMLEMEPGTLLHPEEREHARALIRLARAGNTDGQPFVHRLLTKSGEYRWFETRYSLVQQGTGRDNGIHLTSRDITERRQFEEALRQQTARLESILTSIGDGVVVMDTQRRLVVVNPAARAYIHQSEGDTVPTNWAPVHRAFELDGKTPFPSERGPITRALNGEASTGVKMILHDLSGTPRSFSVSARPIQDRGTVVGSVAIYHDITEQRRAEVELQETAALLRSMTLRDELTGLYNRRGFLEHAGLALRTAIRVRQPACVFFADLDGMKGINDGFGHEVGDRAIAATACVLTEVFRDSDIVARLGGDEFAVFAPQCGEGDVAVIRKRVDAALVRFNNETSEPFSLSISVGAGVFVPGMAIDLNALMERADQSMYEQKRSRVPESGRKGRASA
jgi:diguanylate cyclase (GGDEF)-like protein/PAS domain S-box-containing protein